jgi:hypothetical protein
MIGFSCIRTQPSIHLLNDYWRGVWIKMILQTMSWSTSSAIEECCFSCRDVMYFTRSLVYYYTTDQQIIWNVGLLLPYYMVSLPPLSSYSQRITAHSSLIMYIRRFAYLLCKCQHHRCSKTESTVSKRTVYIYSWQSMQLWSQWHYHGTEFGEFAARWESVHVR